uniref:NADH dehydrogenase subunit 4L n=1 Tax=Panagrolaimus sp. PS1159 TaxID=55785 RepID=A0AC35GJJ0_9BILA
MGIELNILYITIYTFAFVLAVYTATAIFWLRLYHGNLRILLINVSLTHCVALSLAMVSEAFRIIRFDWSGLRMINNLNMIL